VFAALVLILGLAVLFVGVLFVFALLGTAIGAFAGWVISLTPLGVLVENGFEAFGIHASGLLVQIGAMLGFLSGFIRGIVEVKHEHEHEKN
jgi:hypothetical protein